MYIMYVQPYERLFIDLSIYKLQEDGCHPRKRGDANDDDVYIYIYTYIYIYIYIYTHIYIIYI